MKPGLSDGESELAAWAARDTASRQWRAGSPPAELYLHKARAWRHAARVFPHLARAYKLTRQDALEAAREAFRQQWGAPWFVEAE